MMTGGQRDLGDETQLRRVRTTAVQRVTRMLDGSDLRITEHAYELVISNPRDPEKGQVHVAYADGYVCWERVVWDYWGHLEGFEDSMTDIDPRIGAKKILAALESGDEITGDSP